MPVLNICNEFYHKSLICILFFSQLMEELNGIENNVPEESCKRQKGQ